MTAPAAARTVDRAAPYIGVVAAVVEVAGVALPWVRIGSRRITGFDLVAIGREFRHPVATGPAGRLWFALPVLASVAVALLATGRRRAAAALAAAVGVVGGTVASVVRAGAGAVAQPATVLVVVSGIVTVAAPLVAVVVRRAVRPPVLASVKIEAATSHHAR